MRGRIGLVGVSTHSIEEIQAAQSDGAAFVVFGPVFETPGKAPVGLDRLRDATSAATIPVFGIGGVTRDNAAALIEAGCAGVAAIRMFQDSAWL